MAKLEVHIADPDRTTTSMEVRTALKPELEVLSADVDRTFYRSEGL